VQTAVAHGQKNRPGTIELRSQIDSGHHKSRCEPVPVAMSDARPAGTEHHSARFTCANVCVL